MSQPPDPYRYFRVEAREILEGLTKGALALEKGAPAAETVSRLLRLAHTLKGAARVVRQNEIAELAHATEDALGPLRAPGDPASREQVDAILGLIDAMGLRVQALAPPASGGTADQRRTEEAYRSVRTDVLDLDALLDGMAEAGAALQALRQTAGAAERAGHLAELLAEYLAAPVFREEPRLQGLPAKAKGVAEELRGHLGRLESGLGTDLETLGREMRQVREAAERLRLVPAGLIAAPLERAARDAAQAVAREVSFTAEGHDVRVDAHVLSTVQGALIQLVRNAVVHGIEPAAERRQAGKPPEGRVSVETLRRGNQVVFRCRDDGRGVDLEAVRRAAQDKGLGATGDVTPTVEDLLRLLLRGGLTTAGTPTVVSGRGVGLDVVREAVAELRGEVTVQTRSGEGTTVELRVPVSLSSLEALVVEDAGRRLGVPLDAVRRALRVREEDLVRAADGEAVLHEGRAVPFAPLARVLGAREGSLAKGPWTAVIVSGGGRLAGVGVERLHGAASLLVQPLPPLAPAEPLVSGTCLGAEGSPQLVLDPERLVAAVHGAGAAVPTADPPARLPVLVVDDSLTTRMLEQSILESAGFEVELAISGEEALEKAWSRPFGLFLVDVEMPGMDGFAFVERTRADPGLRDVPAILVTSRSSAEDRRRGEEVGARAYIAKSDFDQAELLDTIRRLAR